MLMYALSVEQIGLGAGRRQLGDGVGRNGEIQQEQIGPAGHQKWSEAVCGSSVVLHNIFAFS